MSPMVYDVAVVGAGPAGCAAALRALQVNPEARVALLDATTFPRDKTCGDGIAPHAVDLFASLGVAALTEGFPSVARLAMRSPSGTLVERVMSRPARVIPRRVFDARLVDAASAAGADLLHHRVRRLEERRDCVVIDDDLAARVVIGADGANGVVRRQLGLAPQRRATSGVAVRGYSRTAMNPDALLIAVSDRHCPGYAWSFPLPDGGANVGFGVFGEQVPGGREELLKRLAEELPGCAPEPGSVRGFQLPLSIQHVRQPDGRVLLAGDAAALVNPITGEGIYYAALSGAAAGATAAQGDAAGAVHRATLRRLLARHHRHTGVLARCARSRRFVDATIAAAGRRQHAFDVIVELGLGCGTADPRTLAAVAGHYLGVRRRRGWTSGPALPVPHV